MIKRVVSLLLALVMLTGMLPVFAQAEESEAAIDSSELALEGTNDFGSLVVEDISQEQENVEDQVGAGYTLTDLEITGNTATVTYGSLEEATVVVAIYTEDGMQLLTSGKTTVVADETVTTVNIDGEMPQYFMASAYLLDSYDMSPLCPAFDTPLYTKEMQDLLASTAEDYDPERVLQLEESPETNFAVYAKSTKIVDQVEGVNTVASADEENNTYIIESADENITTLREGDILAYPYGENELLIVKVASIVVEGTTAIITGAEVEIEEVFSYVKLEGSNSTDDFTVDESAAEEGVTYEGKEEIGGKARSSESVVTTFREKFKIDLKGEKSTENYSIAGTLKGSASFNITFKFSYYITLTRHYISFVATPKLDISIGVMGSFTGKVPLLPIGGHIVPGIYIGLKPKLIFNFTGELSFNMTITCNVGVCYDNQQGTTNLSTKPDIDCDVDFEGTFSVGIDLSPTIEVGDGKIAKLNFSVPVVGIVKANIIGTNHEDIEQDAEYIHSCRNCIAMDVGFEVKIKMAFQLLNSKHLSVNIELANIYFPKGKMYYSLDHKEFGYSTCPYLSYRVTINVKDDNGDPVPEASVNSGTNKLGTTNSKGVLVTYLPSGRYNLSTTINNQVKNHSIDVKSATKVVISPSSADNGNNTLRISGILGTVETHKLVDYGTNQVGFNSHKYVLFHEAMTWKDAEQYCEELGGHLVTITSSDEHYAVVQLLTKYGRKNCYWIGLNRDNVDASWNWITGEIFSFAKWAENEPNNHNGKNELYVHMFGKKYTGGSGTKYVGDWNDTSNDGAGYANKFYAKQNFGFICEFDDITSNKSQITSRAIFPGDYSTEVTDTHTLKSASFSELVPHQEYVMFSLDSIDTEEVLIADNLLFIDQAVADENGCLSFRYLQRVNTDLSYVMVCGASNKDLNDAQITFPRMTADGETQIVQPVVVYDGKTLIEGQDYVITGDVDFTEAGEYTCYIRGIYNYTGLVTYTYQVSNIMIPTLTLKAPTLEFKDMITVNAMFEASNLDDVVEMGMITYTEKVDEWSVETAAHVIPGTKYDADTGRYIASSQGIHAKYLGDAVYLACYAKLTDGSYVYTKLASYSPVQYATSKLKGDDVPLKQLVVAMLNYGAAAQTHFEHNVENLANATLTAEQIALPESYRDDMVGTVPAADATKQGAFANNKGFAKRYPAISFEGAFCINYFFNPNYTPVDGITLYYWNEADFNAAEVLTKENASGSMELVIEDGLYRGDITGIAAKDLSGAVYVAAVYSDGTTEWTSGVLGYSIGAYCASQSTKGGTIADLAMATAVYGYQAKQYFG